MKIYKCGTPAETLSANMKCVITAVCIRFENVMYELSYFYDGEYKSVWLDESQFRVKDGDRIIVGFKKQLKVN